MYAPATPCVVCGLSREQHIGIAEHCPDETDRRETNASKSDYERGVAAERERCLAHVRAHRFAHGDVDAIQIAAKIESGEPAPSGDYFCKKCGYAAVEPICTKCGEPTKEG